MPGDSECVKKHVAALLEEADAARIPRYVVGRPLLGEVTALWLQSRSIDDVASELRFPADNLDPETDFEFMRP